MNSGIIEISKISTILIIMLISIKPISSNALKHKHITVIKIIFKHEE